jgi:hypothetical protein
VWPLLRGDGNEATKAPLIRHTQWTYDHTYTITYTKTQRATEHCCMPLAQ